MPAPRRTSGELAVDQAFEPDQAAREGSRSCCAAKADQAALQHVVREHGVVELVAQLVREPAQPLGAVVLAQAAVLGHGGRGRVVETPVQRVEIVAREHEPELAGELRDRLADTGVVVDDLRDH